MMRALAFVALLACGCAAPPWPQPTPLVARLVPGTERESRPEPKERGPYVRARILHAADPEARDELERAFPGASLSAWELDTCGTVPDDMRRFTLALVEGRTRQSLASSEVRVGDERLRLLVAIAFDHATDGSLVLGFTVYRVEPTTLEPLLHCKIEDAPAHSLSVMPCGMEDASGWNDLFLDHSDQVIQCWSPPSRSLAFAAAHHFEARTTDGLMWMLGDVEHEKLLRTPLEQWPEPVWLLTLVPAAP